LKHAIPEYYRHAAKVMCQNISGMLQKLYESGIDL
jgi:hypothetical protein